MDEQMDAMGNSSGGGGEGGGEGEGGGTNKYSGTAVNTRLVHAGSEGSTGTCTRGHVTGAAPKSTSLNSC